MLAPGSQYLLLASQDGRGVGRKKRSAAGYVVMIWGRLEEEGVGMSSHHICCSALAGDAILVSASLGCLPPG